MVYATDEQGYLNEICKIIVEDCGHAMVWIGFAEDDKNKTVRPVAQAGFESGYLKTLKITWSDSERGHGPTGTAIRTGKPSICSNILIDSNFKPWRKEAMKRGYTSSVVLPLVNHDKPFGAVNIYSKEADTFSEDEVQLLGELADDLSYGIRAIRLKVEHQQAEDSLRQTRNYLENLFHYANAPIICWDMKFKITRFNPAFEHLSDYKAEDVLGKNLSMLFPRGSRDKSLREIKRTLAGEYWEVVEIPILRKDGRIRIVLWNSANVYAQDGKTLIATVAQGQDITERKKAEEELLKAHEELEEKIIERTSDLIKTNERLSREVIERQNVEMEIRARNALLRLASRVSSRKEYLDAVIKLFRFWSGAGCVGIRLLNEEGHIPYESYLGFSREFWEKENWLSVKEDKCACIRVITGEFTPAEAKVRTPKGSFYCRNTLELASFPREGQQIQFRGRCIKEGFKSLTIIPIRFKEKIIGAIHFADKNKDLPEPKIVEHLESLAVCVAEDIIKFNLSEKIAKSNESRVLAEEALLKAQMQLAEARRLSDIGTLAATVAHELRNPLAAIQMASYNIKRKAQNPLLDKHLLTIENKVNESEQIISNLLFYSRLRPPQYENINICESINECITLVKRRFAQEKINLDVNISSIKKVSIEADPLQMKEVFCNILNNAYESQTKVDKRVEIKAGIENTSVKFMVKDSGEGIDKNDLERIFDPFFTTKARGTGLGLTVCKQVINLHGGTIDIESEKDKGTVVTVRLPIKKEPRS